MIKYFLTTFTLLLTGFCFSQTNSNNCSCEGSVDTDYKNEIFIYDKPLGQVKHKIKQDFKNEDYLTFTIDKDSSNFFHLTFSYSINGKYYSGWTKKANYLGTYSRVYNDTLFLFAKPTLKAKIKSKIPTWTNALLPIIFCKDKWAYVRLKSNFEGWLKEKDQCSNPYTTCN